LQPSPEAKRQCLGVVERPKPADLPVQSASKVKRVINCKTAKQLDLTTPRALLGTADKANE